MIDLAKCIWEYGKCRVCGAPLQKSANHMMPSFCCRKCTNDFGTAIYAAMRDKTAASEYGIHKCPRCGKFWKADEPGGKLESLCPACTAAEADATREKQRQYRRKSDALKREVDEARMFKRPKCHCCDRPAAPGSYWCAQCKAERNSRYHISADAWSEGEDFTYGGSVHNGGRHTRSGN